MMLGKTRLGAISPLSSLALVIGANLPDADAVVLLAGAKSYMLHHRGISHAAAGILIEWLVLGFLLQWAERKFFKNNGGAGDANDRRGGPWAAALVGLLSHSFLDYLNNYGVRPWIPFSNHYYYGDMVFIVDPYLWLLFGGACVLAPSRGKVESAILILCAAAATGVIYISKQTPGFLYWVWPASIVSLLILRKVIINKLSPGRIAAAAGVLFISYIIALRVLGGIAADETARSIERDLPPGERILAVSRMPAPAVPFKWTVTVETEKIVVQRRMSLLDGNATQWKIAKNTDSPEVIAAAGRYEGEVWRKFARHPVASVIRDASGAPTAVVLMDARFGVDPVLQWCRIEVPIR